MRQPDCATGIFHKPHCLEAWGDLRAFDGTVTIQQPLIAPLYKGRTAHELLALLLGQPDLSPLEIVREHWKRQGLAGEFEAAWRDALEAGLVKGTASPPKAVPREGRSRILIFSAGTDGAGARLPT